MRIALTALIIGTIAAQSQVSQTASASDQYIDHIPDYYEDLSIIQNPLIYTIDDALPTTDTVNQSSPSLTSSDVSSSTIRTLPGHAKPEVSVFTSSVLTESTTASSTSEQTSISTTIRTLPGHAKPEVSVFTSSVLTESTTASSTSEQTSTSTTIRTLPGHAKPEVSDFTSSVLTESTTASSTSEQTSISTTIRTLPGHAKPEIPDDNVKPSSIPLTDNGNEDDGVPDTNENTSQTAISIETNESFSETDVNQSDLNVEDSSQTTDRLQIPLIVIGSLTVLVLIGSVLYYRFYSKAAGSSMDKQGDQDQDSYNNSINVLSVKPGTQISDLKKPSELYQHPNDSEIVTPQAELSLSYFGLEEVHIVSPSSPISINSSNSTPSTRSRYSSSSLKYPAENQENTKDQRESHTDKTLSGVSVYSAETPNPFKGQKSVFW